MVCCRCNRSGYCRGCACVNAKKTYVNCLPVKLGHCANRSTTNGNSISGELSLCDPPCDPSSAINPANVHVNISHPQTVSDHEPSIFQPTDLQILFHQFPHSQITPLVALQLSHGEISVAQNLLCYLTLLMMKWFTGDAAVSWSRLAKLEEIL